MAEGIYKICNNGWDAFVSREHRIAELTLSHSGRDKIIKFVIALFDLVNAVINASTNVSPKTAEGLKATTEALKLTRTVTGLLNALGDTPGAIKDSVQKIYYLVLDIMDPDREIEIEEKVRREELKVMPENGYNTDLQRGLGIFTESLRICASLAFLGGFAIARPIQFAGKFFKELGETTKKIGAQFGPFIMANQIATSAAAIANMVREGIVFNEFSKSDDIKNWKKSSDNLNRFFDAMKEGILTLIETLPDLALSIIGIFQYVVPVVATVCLGLTVASMGIYNAYDKACKSAEAKGRAAAQRKKERTDYYKKQKESALKSIVQEAMGGTGLNVNLSRKGGTPKADSTPKADTE